jgi:hypothetical protein
MDTHQNETGHYCDPNSILSHALYDSLKPHYTRDKSYKSSASAKPESPKKRPNSVVYFGLGFYFIIITVMTRLGFTMGNGASPLPIATVRAHSFSTVRTVRTDESKKQVMVQRPNVVPVKQPQNKFETWVARAGESATAFGKHFATMAVHGLNSVRPPELTQAIGPFDEVNSKTSITPPRPQFNFQQVSSLKSLYPNKPWWMTKNSPINGNILLQEGSTWSELRDSSGDLLDIVSNRAAILIGKFNPAIRKELVGPSEKSKYPGILFPNASVIYVRDSSKDAGRSVQTLVVPVDTDNAAEIDQTVSNLTKLALGRRALNTTTDGMYLPTQTTLKYVQVVGADPHGDLNQYFVASFNLDEVADKAYEFMAAKKKKAGSDLQAPLIALSELSDIAMSTLKAKGPKHNFYTLRQKIKTSKLVHVPKNTDNLFPLENARPEPVIAVQQPSSIERELWDNKVLNLSYAIPKTLDPFESFLDKVPTQTRLKTKPIRIKKTAAASKNRISLEKLNTVVAENKSLLDSHKPTTDTP